MDSGTTKMRGPGNFSIWAMANRSVALLVAVAIKFVVAGSKGAISKDGHYCARVDFAGVVDVVGQSSRDELLAREARRESLTDVFFGVSPRGDGGAGFG